jgi:hypothetical protein
MATLVTITQAVGDHVAVAAAAAALTNKVGNTALSGKYATTTVVDSLYGEDVLISGVLSDIVTAIEEIQAVLPV